MLANEGFALAVRALGILIREGGDGSVSNGVVASAPSAEIISFCQLRSNISDWSDEQLWKAYIQLTQVSPFAIAAAQHGCLILFQLLKNGRVSVAAIK